MGNLLVKGAGVVERRAAWERVGCSKTGGHRLADRAGSRDRRDFRNPKE